MSDQDDDNIETLTNACKFKLPKKRDCTPVFLTEFTNGLVSSEGAKKLQFQCFKSPKDSRWLNVTSGRLSYSGMSSRESAEPLSYFVGVRNKKTGRMKLYDSRYFRLKPDIFTEKASIVSSSNPVVDGEYYKKTQELNESFGLKVKRKAILSRRENAVDSSSLDVSNLLVNELNPDESTTNTAPAQVSYLPPTNRDALIIQEVFDITTIISPHEDSALDVKASELLNATNEEIVEIKSKFCSYVINHLDSGEPDCVKTKYLIYYNYLVEFQNLKYNDIRKKDPTSKIPDPFKTCIMNNFTTLSGGIRRTCPPMYKDKLVAYILVLALFIDDYNVKLNAVANDLNNVKINKLTLIAQTIGCHISTISSESHAVLKLPLYVCKSKPPPKQRN